MKRVFFTDLWGYVKSMTRSQRYIVSASAIASIYLTRIYITPPAFFFQKREELRRELDVANEKLRRLNAENEYVYSHFYLFPL